MFKWFQGAAGKPNADKKVEYQELKNDQLYNPYSEVLVLTGHISTVHQIEVIYENRFITASNDGLAIIWDAETGNKVMVLDHRHGERERVSLLCVLALVTFSDAVPLCVVMTADSLGALHVWNLDAHTDDDPLKETPYQTRITEHNGLIKCLVKFSADLVCSGGSDLCLWNRKGRLLSKFSRKDLEEKSYIHSVLKLDSRHFGVVAASDYKSLAVYDIIRSTMRETLGYDLLFVRYLLSTHQENICCLESISVNLFASGSWDGAIILWSTNSLNAMKMFQCAEGLPKELIALPTAAQAPTAAASGRSSTEIRHIIAIGERYLFAAIGCGFRVYDVLTYEDSKGHPKPLVSVNMAHQQPITHMDFLEDRAMLATASEDNTVRLWGCPNKLKRELEGSLADSQQAGRFLIEEFLGVELNPQRFRKRGNFPLHITPLLLGELFLHSNHVKVVKYLGDYGIVTCSTDFIIIWKDAEEEKEKREIEITSVLQEVISNEYS